jgi:hypothetical protein
MATQYGRYGYRRVAELLYRAGWDVGTDRVLCIWLREGIKVPQKQKTGAAYGSMTVPASGYVRSGAIMSGPMTLWRPRPTMATRYG